MLTLVHASFATVDELFRYKHQGFELPDFPGYTADQWGIKAHNRPWIEDKGGFRGGQRIIEVGGGYSLLPKHLAEKYGLEAWIGDDFGISSDESLWSRWGNPLDLPEKYPSVKYVFAPLGGFSSAYPDSFFDRIFTVSTLEHIPVASRLATLRDIHRCLKPGGRELHTIDIATMSLRGTIVAALATKLRTRLPFLDSSLYERFSEVGSWIETFRASGVRISTSTPNPLQLLNRQTLVESPDVVYRFYRPNDAPKPYWPGASLLLVVEDQ